MKLLYIASEFGISNGTNTNMMVHYRTLINILGKDNVYTIDLNSGGKQIETTKSKSYLKPVRLMDKLIRGIQGHTALMSNSIVRDILKIISDEKIGFVFVDESLYGQMVRSIKKKYPDVKVACFYHDVKRNLYLQWIKKEGIGAAVKRYIPGLVNEKKTAIYSDYNITLNGRESQMLKQYYGKDATLELPVGISEPQYNGDLENPFTAGFNLLFVGAKYYANILGAKWFCENVIPQLDSDVHLWIVGKGMEVLRTELVLDRVHVVGTVDSLSKYYQYADVVIAPIFEGAGMKVKTAEALSYGKCFVGTLESEIGYMEYCPKDCRNLFFECNTAETFVATIDSLKQKGVQKEYQQIKCFFKNNYSLQSIEDKLRKILN